MSRGRSTGSKKSGHKIARNITISIANDEWLKTKDINLSAKVDEMLTAMRYEDMRITAIVVDGDGVHEISAKSQP